MPDEPDITGQPAESARGIGEQLKAAREAQNLSVEQVAAELHLAETQIQALESEQFDTLGAPVFVRGHYRKYSDLLKADTAALLQQLNDHYDAAEPDQSVIETEVARTLHREKRLNGLIIAITVIVLLGILVYLAIRYAQTSTRSATTDQNNVETVAEEALADDGRIGAEPEFAAVNSGGQSLTLPEPTEQVSAELVEGPRQASGESDVQTYQLDVALDSPVASRPTVSIRLIFNEDSWIEAVDGDRRRLMYGIGRANTQRTLQGAVPIEVFFGYADGVEIEVDGEAFPLQNARRRGNTAQITIDGN